MKPPFGALNATLAKTVAENAPRRYRRIVEPFGDGGTFALHVGHRPPREHFLNVVDSELFGAMLFVQKAKSVLRELKHYDWVASQEAFEKAVAISATEGPDAFYRFFYLKKFGMKMGPDQPWEFDLVKSGQTAAHHLYGLPMMRAMLKRVRIVNEDPMAHVAGAADTFSILLPRLPEEAEAVKGRLTGLGGSFFFAAKAADAQGVMEVASQFSDYTVAPLPVASIMLNTFAVVVNYDSKLIPIDPDGTMGGMDM